VADKNKESIRKSVFKTKEKSEIYGNSKKSIFRDNERDMFQRQKADEPGSTKYCPNIGSKYLKTEKSTKKRTLRHQKDA